MSFQILSLCLGRSLDFWSPRIDAVLWEKECINVPGNVTGYMESFETSAGILQAGEATELASRDTLQGKSVFLGMGWRRSDSKHVFCVSKHLVAFFLSARTGFLTHASFQEV